MGKRGLKWSAQVAGARAGQRIRAAAEATRPARPGREPARAERTNGLRPSAVMKVYM